MANPHHQLFQGHYSSSLLHLAARLQIPKEKYTEHWMVNFYLLSLSTEGGEGEGNFVFAASGNTLSGAQRYYNSILLNIL